jgi:ER-derived vesicles protein
MLAGSYMVIGRKQSEIGVGALLGVVVSQALGYGLVFDVNFFFR